MGDRCNFVFTDKPAGDASIEGCMVLYSHWGGESRLSDLAEALEAARGRWDDPAYGRRIVVDQLTKPGRDEETGYGLSVGELCDNEHPLTFICFNRKQVWAGDMEARSFAEFVAYWKGRES